MSGLLKLLLNCYLPWFTFGLDALCVCSFDVCGVWLILVCFSL